ncbi:MAG TPA: TldD/PmbA family protein [Gemmatimonadales bacterium]|nr:TldD/PmbA family protein [Gemmatimonadales bacterium]
MLDQLLDALRASRADFTDIRCERVWTSTAAARGRRVEGLAAMRDAGGVIRCLVQGRGWSSVSFTGFDHLGEMVTRAWEAALTVQADPPPRLAPVPPRELTLVHPPTHDPRTVPLPERRKVLDALSAEVFGLDRRLTDLQLSLRDEVTERWYVSSEGTKIHDLRSEGSLALVAVAREAGLTGRALDSLAIRGGWDALLGREGWAREVAERAVALLGAVRPRPGEMPVVLDPRATGVMIHAALAHRLEGDGAAPLRLGAEIGSPFLTVGDDASASPLRGTASVDDEGTPAQPTVLVQSGVVVARLHTRQSAGRTGEAPTGNARAGSFRHFPSARVSNFYLRRGEGTLDDLLAGVRTGIYVRDARGATWDGEQLTLTAGEGAMIRDGRLAEPVRDVLLRGTGAEWLGGLDGVAGDFTWNPAASLCVRGAAGPVAVSDGAPHARIRRLQVGGVTA